MTTLVVDHELSFAEVAARLRAGGWRQEADPGAPAPLVADEPEDSEWVGDEARLRYHFEPATGLRALYLSGARADGAAATLAQQLPCRGITDARALLGEPAVDARLRGLQMVEVLEACELFDEVAALTGDANATVAQRARLTGARLALLATGDAVEFLAQWQREHPEKSAAFLLTGSAAAKNQVLRWLAHTRRTSNPNIDGVLRTALDDADWEVRMTAIAVAGRLRARELVAAVIAARLPEDTADGVNQDERRMLQTIKLCAVERMQGANVPAMDIQPPTTRERMHVHLLRCLAGASVRHHEKAFLYLTSLLEPLPDETPQPASLPPGIVRAAGGYLLENGRIDLCWVPPVEHWLGEDLPRMHVQNPIRRERARGFFIARDLLRAPGTHATEPLLCDYVAALEHARRLSTTTGLTVRLPTADEWEMAARGPDGRRFTWGNNARHAVAAAFSPWGMREVIGRASQWTQTRHGNGVLVCGGRQWVCAMRTAALCDGQNGVRLVVEL